MIKVENIQVGVTVSGCESTGYALVNQYPNVTVEGETDHSQLDNVTWNVSGHIGDANKVAGFDASGLPVYKDPTKIIPPVDSTTAVQIMKADGVTKVAVFDSTNKALLVDTIFSLNDSNSLATTLFRFRAELALQWSNNATYYGTKDVGIRRLAAGLLQLYDGITTTTYRDLAVRSIHAQIEQYQYQATSPTADTVNDTRFRNNAGVLTFERCTVANVTKGAGNWVVTLTIP